MSDEISQEVRRLIDEAVAAGRITRIATGDRGIRTGAVEYNHTSGRLVYSDKESAAKRLRNGVKWGKGK